MPCANREAMWRKDVTSTPSGSLPEDGIHTKLKAIARDGNRESEGNHDPDTRPLTGSAFEIDRAPERLHGPRDERQADAGTFMSA